MSIVQHSFPVSTGPYVQSQHSVQRFLPVTTSVHWSLQSPADHQRSPVVPTVSNTSCQSPPVSTGPYSLLPVTSGSLRSPKVPANHHLSPLVHTVSCQPPPVSGGPYGLLPITSSLHWSLQSPAGHHRSPVVPACP